MAAVRATANSELYQTAEVLAFYARHSELQPAERAIRDLLEHRLARMDMLDLGVGAGRTTPFFAPLAQSYLGVDLSPAMVAESRRRHPGRRFEIGDARSLLQIAPASLDFILFSFNGLDCLEHFARETALRRFHQALRPGGALAFSSHNMNFVTGAALARPAPFLDPVALFDRLRSYLRFQRSIRAVRYHPGLDVATVVEAQFGRLVEIVYVRPEYQVDQLRDIGFRNIRLFAGDSGDPAAPDSDAARAIADPWVYYLCDKAGSSLG